MHRIARLLLIACAVPALVVTALAQSAEFHQTYPLSPEGRVALKNVNGNVHITVWDRSEVQVNAVKTARDPETIAATDIRVEAQPDAITIRTESRDQQRLANVEYSLSVPRRAALDSIDLVNGALDVDGAEGRVRVKSVNGAIVAKGLSGDVRLSTVNGRITSEFARLDPSAHVALESVNGEVEAALPAGAGAQLKASTVHGAIDDEFGSPVNRESVGQRLEAPLGAGGAPVSLQTVNGGIHIRRR